jgi:predicted N-formylglutamate amidohydrolase
MAHKTAREPIDKALDLGALLAPGEPPAATVVGGDADGIVLLCDHASNRVPAVLDNLGLAAPHFRDHIAYDIGAEPLARTLAARFEAPLVLSGYSRLVVDCNREPGDPTSIPEISDDVIVPGNRALNPNDIDARIDQVFAPYHAAIATLIEARLAAGKRPAIVSVHSFTPVFKGFERPWEVGVLWNEDGRLALPFMDALAARGVAVGDNEPYSARENFGYSIAIHGEARGLPHLLIEVRQDLIHSEPGRARWADTVGGALDAALTTFAGS